jgi:hypothetical protein
VFSDSRTGRLARATGGSPADVRGGASVDP